MLRVQTNGSTTLPNWAIAIFAILLLFPLIELPRPMLLATPPWKVELVVSLFLLTALFLSRGASFSTPDRTRQFVLFLTLFTAWSGMSVIWAQSSGPVVHHTFTWAVYLVVFLFALAAFRRSQGIGSAVVFAGVTTSILAILCILDFVTLVDFTASEGTLRIRWAKYAELLVTILPFLWAIACHLRGRDRWTLLLIGIGGWIAAMLSLSRSAFISGSVGFVILFVSAFFLTQSRHRRTIVQFAAIWIVLTVGFQLGSAYLTSVPATAQYISGSADPTRSNATMRVFTWTVTGSMIKESPVLGVGADNFGIAFNDGRKAYAAANPQDPNNAIGEDYLFERTHNEYLQIAAELGIPGLLLFSFTFLTFAVWLFRRIWINSGRVPPALLGAIAGMTAFASSSLFTSFSFRAFQNGVTFFVMAAAAAYLVSKRVPTSSQSNIRFAFPVALLATSGLAVFSGLVAASQIFSTIGERQSTPAETKQNLQRSLAFYPENGGTQLSLASVESRHGDHKRAADLTRAVIANGVGASIAYARLAEYEEKAGNTEAAVAALEEAIAVFPRSSYLRAYLVLLLERTANPSRAEKELQLARELDLTQANGWYALIKLGSKDAYQVSRKDPNTAGPAELLPQNAIYQYLNEDMSR